MAGSLFYANVTKGYKAGSFPTIGAATVSQYRPVVQESVIAYEAGFKQELFDRSVLLTGAGFYYDYRNKQLRGFFDQPPFGTVFALDNVPKSTVKGGELAIVWRPVDGLNLSGAVTYVDAKIKKYSGLNPTGYLLTLPATGCHSLRNGMRVQTPTIPFRLAPAWQ
ncbi:TonB-dependent receptor domain-containing protein [Rhizorhabdus histidinilytica]